MAITGRWGRLLFHVDKLRAVLFFLIIFFVFVFFFAFAIVARACARVPIVDLQSRTLETTDTRWYPPGGGKDRNRGAERGGGSP